MDYDPPGQFALGWHEYGCYIGLLPCLLFFASMKNGWRWWHWLTLACFWLALGNSDWFHISRWLAEVPILSSMRVATRWRVMGILGIALACGQILDQWRLSPRIWIRMSANCVAVAIALDLLVNSYPVYREAFVIDPQMMQRPDGTDAFVHLHNHRPPPKANSAILRTLLANYGVVYGYEPLIGQDVSPLSGLLWVGHPDYRAEYWSDSGPVELVRWSPNKIRLRAPPLAEVYINQNPGSYWLSDGIRLFRSLRAVDRHETFKMKANVDGSVELTVMPRSLSWGLALMAIGLVGCAALAFIPALLPVRKLV
jgi:hypothetical protein